MVIEKINFIINTKWHFKKIKYLYNIYKLRKKYKNILYYKYKHKINEEVISNFNQFIQTKNLILLKNIFANFWL